MMRLLALLLAALALFRPIPTPAQAPAYDVIIRGGTVYDGSGAPGKRADVGVRGDAIAAVGDLSRDTAKVVVDARGLAVAPGFINMLSWSVESLLADGRGQSEIRQGVTTQIIGESHSWGPVNDAIKKRMRLRRHLVVPGMVIVLLAGCSGPTMAPVKGRVVCHGKPVSAAAVVFSPVPKAETDRESGDKVGEKGLEVVTP